MASLLSYSLTTLADVKETMGIASSDTSWDNFLVRKINQATRAIEAYCGRRFALTTYTNEEYDATNTNQIILRQRPIVTLTTLDVRDSGLNITDFESIESDLYFYDANAGVLELNFTARGSWNRFRVTYSAGYSTIPEDLAEACATLASYYALNPDGSQIGVKEKQEGQRKISYGSTTNSFLDVLKQLGIDTIIDSYSNYPVLTDR